jgi:hypothetical protein
MTLTDILLAIAKNYLIPGIIVLAWGLFIYALLIKPETFLYIFKPLKKYKFLMLMYYPLFIIYYLNKGKFPKTDKEFAESIKLLTITLFILFLIGLFIFLFQI